MNRRSLLCMLGLGPVVAVHAAVAKVSGPALPASPATLVASEFVANADSFYIAKNVSAHHESFWFDGETLHLPGLSVSRDPV